MCKEELLDIQCRLEEGLIGHKKQKQDTILIEGSLPRK